MTAILLIASWYVSWIADIAKGEKFTGILAPVFSLPEVNFSQLTELGYWAADVGFKVIQILPLQDTGNSPSPYDQISSYALNPVYFDVKKVTSVPLYDTYHKFRYGKIRQLKLKVLRQYFTSHKNDIIKSKEIGNYIYESEWFIPYSLFVLQYYQNKRICKKDWQQWKQRINPDSKQLDDYLQENQEELYFQAWLQYHLEKQLVETKANLNQKGIYLLGDMPFALNGHSADCYHNPELYDFNLHVGAPPDQFSAKGQNWRFPRGRLELFSSSEKLRQMYSLRLKRYALFFDGLRLDHALGYFRVWAIASNYNNGRHGSFLPAATEQQIQQGLAILKYFNEQSTMQLFAEDLGVVPEYISPALLQNKIPGLIVPRWLTEYHPDASNYLSVTAPTIHDSSGLREWVSTLKKAERNSILDKPLSRKLNVAEMQELLLSYQTSASHLVVHAIADLLAASNKYRYRRATSERINTPGTRAAKNWKLRLPYAQYRDVDFMKFLQKLTQRPLA